LTARDPVAIVAAGFRMSTTLPNALSALDRAPVWLNSEPLTAARLRGKVVLVDFWTYSCVNWLRTLPYVRGWAERYRDRGLVVVGAHAPEFSFEHDLDNVRRAVAELEVGYPVAIDNDFAIWRSFDNHYWPAVYLVDMSGRVRFTHFGEEAYAETEQAIQGLLGIDEPELVRVDAGGRSLAADWATLRTPETYVGYARGEGRIDPRDSPALNQWSLSGEWTVDDEFAELDAAGGSITFRFEGRDVNLVMTPPPDGSARFSVRLDGEPPGDDHGVDVSASGDGAVDEPRMFQLVRQRQAGPRTVEVTFGDAGVRAYVFTFG
jgi:thiol-disulfide isomerase/thioredoxin